MPLHRNAGFTLLELIVTVAIIAILATLAFPSFQDTMNSSRLTGAANELVAAVQTARAEAIRYNRRAVICLSANANATAPSCAANNTTTANGWLVFVDTDKNGNYTAAGDGASALKRIGFADGDVRVLGSSNLTGKVKVVFRADGLARSGTGAILNGTYAVCMPTVRPPENVRLVSVRGGSAAITRAIGNGLCTEPVN